jgi:GNAT superfamily N-acetyltransferase
MRANPAVRAFVAQLVAGWRTSESAGQTYAATCAHEGVRGLALCFPRGSLVLGNSAPRAAAAFAIDLPDTLRALPAVNGEHAACSAFAARWSERTGCRWSEGAHLRHHRLTRVEPLAASPGRMRPATVDDTGWLTRMSLEFAKEVGIPDPPEAIVEGVHRRVPKDRFRIWDDGEAVAFAGWAPAEAESARIAPVYTLPGHRGRGYATALTAALSRELLASGRRELFLMTDVMNPTSNAIYARIGYRPVSDAFRFDFEPGAPVR